MNKMRGFFSRVVVLANKSKLIKCGTCADPQTLKMTGFPNIRIGKDADVNIGKNVIIRSNPDGIGNFNGSKIVIYHSACLKIGDYVGFSNVVLHCFEKIVIGNHVNVGDGCMIFDSNFHSTDWKDRLDRKKDVLNAKTSPIIIKDFPFIGARSIICKGVTIGEKSMIAAGSCVVKDVPDGELWGGSPAKFIKMVASND